MTEIQTECAHKRVNYGNPMSCMDCGAVLGDGLKVAEMADLTNEQREAIEKASAGLQAIQKPLKRRKARTTVEVENVPAKAVSKPKAAQKVKKGILTRLEVATPKERIFVVNGIKFYAAVGGSGHRILSACDENKKTLESAGRVLLIKGYTVKVKRVKDDKTLWMLEAREKVPSGPWLDEEPAKA
jgi:hypothetical protein